MQLRKSCLSLSLKPGGTALSRRGRAALFGFIPILHDSATDRGSPAVAAPLTKGLFSTRILLPPFFSRGVGGIAPALHL